MLDYVNGLSLTSTVHKDDGWKMLFFFEIELYFDAQQWGDGCVSSDVSISCFLVNQLYSSSATTWSKDAVNTSDVIDDSEFTNVMTYMFFCIIFSINI